MKIYQYKQIAFVALVAIVSLVASPALANPLHHVASLKTPGTERTLFLPAAADNARVISLGAALDPESGELVEGYAFIHYKKGFAKPPWAGGGKEDKGSTCYAFLAKDARWKDTEGYVVDPANVAGLAETDVRSLMAAGANTWDNEVAFDIFGFEVAGTVDGADSVSPDGKNEVLFANVESPGAIAVTIVWGIFGGRPSARKLVEWDMIFDDVDFFWGTDGGAGAMDFQNIATHEIGHAAGMGHPDDSCTEETMYRFADFGETKKRDLNAGDIAGVVKLYE